MHERVDRDLVSPVVELGCAGEMAVHEQEGHLQEGRLLSQLLDWIAPVLQDALVAIDERDGRPARGRGHVGRVVGEQAEVVLVGLDLAQLGGPDRAVLDRDLVLLAGPVVGDAQGLGGSGYAGAVLRCCASRWSSHSCQRYYGGFARRDGAKKRLSRTLVLDGCPVATGGPAQPHPAGGPQPRSGTAAPTAGPVAGRLGRRLSRPATAATSDAAAITPRARW